MSGICGICEPGVVIDRSSADAMVASLALEGKSERQVAVGHSLALGVARRWPEQQLGRIPGVQIAANTDLLDTNELKACVARNGIETAQLTAAELLAWAYKFTGMEFLNCLSGAFALALWEEDSRRLLLVVDRLGINRLFWSFQGRRLWFASRPSAIVSAFQTTPDLDPAAIVQLLLFSTIPAPLSAYRGIRRLEPGHWVMFEAGQCQEHRYWDMHYEETAGHSEEYWARELREAMRASVHRHLDGCAAQSAGAYLSGGTDSSSVVAFMSERYCPVRTFSIFFGDPRYSEIGFARTTARQFRTRHFEKMLGSADALQAIEKVTGYYDEPFANSSAIGSYYCALLARENGVDTLLGGDGGDELFAGNERYATDKRFQLYHSVPAWLRHTLIEPTLKFLPKNGGPFSLPYRYVRRANIPNPQRILSYSLFLNSDPTEVFESDFLQQAPRQEWLKIAEERFMTPAASELNRLLYMDVKMTLADNDIPKVSGTAELAGVRARFPLLDHRLAEFSGRIPARLKMKGFSKRYIFKKAMQGILPREVLLKKKHGFGVPLSSWLLQDPKLNAFMRDVLYDARTRQRGIFRPQFLEHLMNLHRREHPIFYGEVIWYLLVLELWQRRQAASAQRCAVAD
jgi:asparagine synthase (glutamine-hydrolysing)